MLKALGGTSAVISAALLCVRTFCSVCFKAVTAEPLLDLNVKNHEQHSGRVRLKGLVLVGQWTGSDMH